MEKAKSMTTKHVIAVVKSAGHAFSKQVVSSIEILEGLGVIDDCHSGVTVKHRSPVRVDPTQPNLRQVQLIHSKLFEEHATRTPSGAGERVALP